LWDQEELKVQEVEYRVEMVAFQHFLQSVQQVVEVEVMLRLLALLAVQEVVEALIMLEEQEILRPHHVLKDMLGVLLVHPLLQAEAEVKLPLEQVLHQE
tara:strand:- start:107 stop:403 length:297 start_codon:yes stop_codon:yes gene_type:complete